MTRTQHYRKAEEHLDFANEAPADAEGWMGDRTRYHLAAAQVHAILATTRDEIVLQAPLATSGGRGV